MWNPTTAQRAITAVTDLPRLSERLMVWTFLVVHEMGDGCGLRIPGCMVLWDGESGTLRMGHGVEGGLLCGTGTCNGLGWVLDLKGLCIAPTRDR